MTEADGEEMLKTLYRVIDVEKGRDKMLPEDSAEIARLMKRAWVA